MFYNKEPKTILVPWNFSENSEIALRKAMNLASESTRVHLVHVAAPLTSGDYGMVDLIKDFVCPYETRFRKDYRKYAQDPRVRYETYYGFVAPELVRCANRFNPDVIVLAARQRSRFVKLFLGSVVDLLKSQSQSPVLVLKPAPRQPLFVGRESALPSSFGEAI